MIRHEELGKDGIPYLMPAPTAITIYPQYYLKAIGTWLRMVEHWLAIHGKKLWMDRTGDIKLV